MRTPSKPQEIYNIIKNDILNKKYKINEKLPTEQQLLEMFSCDRSTIREVLTILSTEGIIKKKHGLGSFVTRIPSRGTIAVCVRFGNLTSLTDFYSRLINNINEFAEERGYDIILAVGYGDTIETIKKNIDAYFRKPFSREIVAVVNLLNFEINPLPVPTINITSVVPFGDNCICIDYDEVVKKGKELMENMGYKDTTIFYTLDSVEKAGEAIVNHISQLANSWTDNEDLKFEVDTYYGFYEKFKAWYESPKRTRAAFFLDDGLLELVIRFFYENSIKIPEDFAVLTYGNAHKYFNHSIDFHKLGADEKELAKLVLENLDILLKGKSIGTIKLPPHYHKGNSL